MKWLYILLSAVFGLSYSASAQLKLENKITLLNGKVEILVPSVLAEMNQAQWTLKYGTSSRPELALSDPGFEVSLNAQYTSHQRTEDQLQEYKDFRIASLKKTRTDVQILNEGIIEIHGKKVGFFTFNTQAIGSEIYNYYFFTVVDGKVLLFHFNCKESLRNDWEKTSKEIANSLVVK